MKKETLANIICIAVFALVFFLIYGCAAVSGVGSAAGSGITYIEFKALKERVKELEKKHEEHLDFRYHNRRPSKESL